MARIIGLVNQKGGVGKSTSAINLSSYLAAMGKYVLLVDIDPQANATSGVGIDPRTVPLSLYHSLIGGLLPEEVIKKTGLFGCDIIPSSPDLAGATIELVGMPNREFKLHELLRRIRTNYDYILIDCPPSLGLLTINGLVAAEEIIIPVQCEYYALEGLGQLLRTVDLVQENLGSPIKIKGALLTMYDRRNRLSRQVRKEMERNFSGHVFESIIPRCVKLAEAPSFGQSIIQYNPHSKGAKAYRFLAQEVIDLDK
ncbi:MAG: AAA family ATPase [Candidatus Portnoybacteria bacterium]